MRLSRNVFCLFLIMMLPIGYYADENDSTSVWFRAGGGVGQYSTVIQSCDEPPKQFSNSFSDVGGEIVIRPSMSAPVMLGLRGGHLSAGIESSEKYGNSLENGYLNPHIAVELENFGAGIGWVRNLGPVMGDDVYLDFLKDVYDFDPILDFRRDKNFISGHARLGSYSSIYAIGSLNEGIPIVSQYGYFLLGMGYGGVPGWHFTSGVSGGFYNQGGFYLGIGRDLPRYGRPELSFRLGSAEGDFEGGFSLNWTIPIK